MRRAAAVVLVSVVALTGCGSSSSGKGTAATTPSSAASSTPTAIGTPVATPGTAGPFATATGGFGATPTVTATGTPPASLQAKVLSPGNGPSVAKGDLLVVNYVGQTWRANKKFDSSFDRKEPAAFPIGVGQVIQGWDKSLVGAKVGSRMELVIPPVDGYGASGQAQAGIKGDDTLVFVVDVLGAFGRTSSAKGTPVPPKAGLPTVTSGATGPVITVPKSVPPSTLVAQPLITGSGPAVAKGQTIVVQYVGVLWRTGKVFDSSWSRGTPATFQIGTGKVIAGWDEALVGQKVGSRVLLSIPPSKGYGSAGQPDAGITGTDTLVFAVDILGAF